MSLSRVYLHNGTVRAWRDNAGTLHLDDTPDPATCDQWRAWIDAEPVQIDALRDAVWGTVATLIFLATAGGVIVCLLT